MCLGTDVVNLHNLLLLTDFGFLKGFVFDYYVSLYRLHENFELLKSRLMTICDSREALELEIQKQSIQNRKLISEMNGTKPEIKRLYRERERYKK